MGALLPIRYFEHAPFQHGTRPSVEEIESAGFQSEFEAFSAQIAGMFFGLYVLHQVAEGQDFPKCCHGSMETRYLILAPRRSLHRFSAMRLSCISPGGEGDADPSLDARKRDFAREAKPPDKCTTAQDDGRGEDAADAATTLEDELHAW